MALTVAVSALWGMFRLSSVLILLVIPLIPIAITIAVLRHQLLDIRLVISRTVLYALLTTTVVVAYAGLVAALNHLAAGFGGSALATVVIAVGFNPVRMRLQYLVDRLLYGERADPVKAVSLVAGRLAEHSTGLDSVLAELCAALRLPYAAIESARERAVHGVVSERLHTVSLVHGGEHVGELTVGLRTGERRLSPADKRVLGLLAVPLAAAVQAIRLKACLTNSEWRSQSMTDARVTPAR